MSDQTPPTGQPTPPTPGAEGSTPGQPATPPPPPPVDPGADTSVEEPPPAPKSRKGLLLGVVAGLVVLALIGGGLAAFLMTRGPETHSITLTSTAGGMKRDTAGEAKLKQQLDATTKQFEAQFGGTSVKSGLYKQDKSSRGPEGQLLFLSFEFKTASDKNPGKMVEQLRTLAKANQLKVTNVPTGDAGGKAVCLGIEGAQKNASCLWATRDTAGGLFPNIPGYDSEQLSKIMLDMRSDVEKTD